MTNHNAANERIKRRYFTYLTEALGHSEQTIDAVAKAISRFEAYTRFRDFKAFHIEQAKGFKHSLSAQRGSRSGEPDCRGCAGTATSRPCCGRSRTTTAST